MGGTGEIVRRFVNYMRQRGGSGPNFLNHLKTPGNRFAAGGGPPDPVVFTFTADGDVNVNIVLTGVPPAYNWEMSDGTIYNDVTNLVHAIGVDPTQTFSLKPETLAVNILQVLFPSSNLIGSIPSLTDLTSLQLLYLYSNQLAGSIPSLTGLTSITQLRLYNNQLTGSIPSLTDLTSMTKFWAYNNQLTGSIPSLTGLTSITQLLLYNNQLTGSIPSLTDLTSMTHLWVHNNQLTSYTASTISITLTNINLSNNALDVASVNQLLIDVDTTGHLNGTLNLSGGTNAAPTGAGLTAVTALQGKGWTVTTN